MFFTIEDYKKIQEWLSRNSIKDTEFNEAMQPFKGNEIISFVQNGHNTKAYLKDFVDQLFLLGIPDFVNITEKFDESNISLSRAIQLIPYKSRKTGQVITFLNEEGIWKIYQFKGKRKNQWNEESLWVDIIRDIASKITTLADEEDITTVEENGATVFKFKDKAYSPDSFSGKGRVYLRKNIVTVKDPKTSNTYKTNLLTQQMLSKENTIYVIQYDYNLNGQTITVPEGCILQFEGGSISNGLLTLNNCIIQASYYIFKDLNIEGTSYINPKWFGVIGDGKVDDSDAFEKSLNQLEYVTIDIRNLKIRITRTINSNKWGLRFIGDYSISRGTNSGIFFENNEDICLNLLTDNTIFENVAMFSVNTSIHNIAVNLDTENENNLDCRFTNCFFADFAKCIVSHGRGLMLYNNFFTRYSRAVECYLYKDSDIHQNEDNLYKNGYTGRKFIFDGNQGHGCNYPNSMSIDPLSGRLFYLLKNEDCPDSTFYCVKITRNYNDNLGGLVYSNARVRNIIITDNILARCSVPTTKNSGIYFTHLEEAIISNNNFGGYRLSEVSTFNHVGNFIIFDNTEDSIFTNIIISSNIFGSTLSDAININNDGGYDNYITNITISNNTWINGNRRNSALCGVLRTQMFINNCIISDNSYVLRDNMKMDYPIQAIIFEKVTESPMQIKNVSVKNNLNILEYPTRTSPGSTLNISISSKDLVFENYIIDAIENSNYQLDSRLNISGILLGSNGKIYHVSTEEDLLLDNDNNPRNTIGYGSTEQRPTNVQVNFQYYDATLKKPIWWIGSRWIDATGASV